MDRPAPGWRPGRYVGVFFFQAEDGIRDDLVTGVQTCALPISPGAGRVGWEERPEESLAVRPRARERMRSARRPGAWLARAPPCPSRAAPAPLLRRRAAEIGRASCRERVAASRGGGA